MQIMNNQCDHNDKTYFIHPTFQNYAASIDGYIINRKRLEPRRGNLSCNGYYNVSLGSKSFPSHRFIFEAVNQSLIPTGMQVNHINSNKQDNSIENLSLVTPSQNMKHMHKAKKAFFERPYSEEELQTINRLIASPPIEDNDCEFTRTENKIISKMFYRMCHDMDDTNFPLYRD